MVVTREQFTAYKYVSHDECGKRLDGILGRSTITGGVRRRGVKRIISRADVTTTCRVNFGRRRRTPGRPRHGNRVRHSRARCARITCAFSSRLERKISLYRARRSGGRARARARVLQTKLSFGRTRPGERVKYIGPRGETVNASPGSRDRVCDASAPGRRKASRFFRRPLCARPEEHRQEIAAAPGVRSPGGRGRRGEKTLVSL